MPKETKPEGGLKQCFICGGKAYFWQVGGLKVSCENNCIRMPEQGEFKNIEEAIIIWNQCSDACARAVKEAKQPKSCPLYTDYKKSCKALAKRKESLLKWPDNEEFDFIP